MNATAHGGLRLEAYKDRSTERPIANATVTSQLVVPLDQHVGSPAKPVVRVGQRVRRGEPIGAADTAISARVHSPVSGRVFAIEARAVPHHAGTPALCVVIENDFVDEIFEASQPTA